MMINRPPGVDNMAYQVQGYMYVTQLLLKDIEQCVIYGYQKLSYTESHAGAPIVNILITQIW